MPYRVSRRYFFFGTLLAGAIPSRGFGSITSLKALGYKPYYNKMNVAAIGAGGRAGVILDQAAETENIVALCDVDENRAAERFQKYSGVPKYKDFREMIDKEGGNIEGVTIGIPDFMHATAALYCMQRGKHVYVEKPLTRTPWEARLLQDAAVKYKVATQMGNQGFSHDAQRVAAEILWSGEIGDVTEVHVTTTPGTHPTSLQEPPPESAVPETLDWNLWVGGAQMRPYSGHYTPYNWRGFFDFGTGQIGNWATHTAGPVHHALMLGAPTSVECISKVGGSELTFPDSAVIKIDFPARGGMPPVTVYYHDSARPDNPASYRVPGMENETLLPRAENLDAKRAGREDPPPQPPRARAAAGPPQPRRGAGGPGVAVFGEPLGPSRPGVLTGNGAIFAGSKGFMATCSRGEGVHLLPSARWREYKLPPQLLTRSPGHMADWIRACKGGESSCADFSIAAPYAEWLALAAIAFRVPGKLEWDSRNLRFTNSEQANKYVKPAFRTGWELTL